MKIQDYGAIPIVECDEPMADLAGFPFILEPMNFRKGYAPGPRMWLRQSVALKLEQAQRVHLEPHGLRLRIWDAWRPRDVQAKVYAACWNHFATRHPEWHRRRLEDEVSRFVRNSGAEEGIPPHATGGAVDLTICDEATGCDLEMGSGYCDWEAEPIVCPVRSTAEEARICDNRRRLTVALQEAGFTADPYQWWHYDYGNQKWARVAGAEVAIYGEMVGGSMGFMKKGWAYGHGMKLPYESREPS